MPAPERGSLWGILGGTFDPVHAGHLTLADNLQHRRNLVGVLLIPAFNHPFKQERDGAPYHHRAAMLRLAAAPFPKFEVCEIESERNLSGYTLDTVLAVKNRFPERRFCFIVGADNLDQIERWHQPDRILAEVPILAGARPGYRLKNHTALPADRIELIETEEIDISSSTLRGMIVDGATDDQLQPYLPPAVLDYIRKEQLYR